MSHYAVETNYTDGLYCERFEQFMRREYMPVHGIVAVTICLIGCTLNLLNVVVLSRKEMASSTNSILTALAVTDLIVMINFIPYALYNYTSVFTDPYYHTYGWAVTLYIITLGRFTLNTMAVWLTVTLAVWRYIAIKFPLKSIYICNRRNTTIAIASAYIVGLLCCLLPICFWLIIKEAPKNYRLEYFKLIEIKNATANYTRQYYVGYTDSVASNTAAVSLLVMSKIVPCLTLSLLSVLLILEMKISNIRRQKLLNVSFKKVDQENVKNTQSIDRTTRMLVGLVLLFLATEIPPSTVRVLHIIAPHLFRLCFRASYQCTDLMILTGSAVNFVVYCTMSSQFRSTLARLARQYLSLPSVSKNEDFRIKNKNSFISI